MKNRLRPCFLWRIVGVSAVFWRILASGVFKKKFREMRIRQTNTPDQIAAAYKRTTFWSFLNAPVWRILDRFTHGEKDIDGGCSSSSTFMILHSLHSLSFDCPRIQTTLAYSGSVHKMHEIAVKVSR